MNNDLISRSELKAYARESAKNDDEEQNMKGDKA